MGDYHNLYLKSDVILLTDVPENFRRTCKQHYKLDPCHYFPMLLSLWFIYNINLWFIITHDVY